MERVSKRFPILPLIPAEAGIQSFGFKQEP